jgi:hypothetical protein
MPNASPFVIEELKLSDLSALKQFTDREIGSGYYSQTELDDIFRRSQKNGRMCSFLLKKDGEIFGVRFTYPPGNWSHGKGDGLSPAQWPFPMKDTAYFQSLFLSDRVQGAGWGGRLSAKSIEVLKDIGAKGIVCHSWKESPNNSSTKYLEKMGFQKIKEHPRYWQHVNYNCTRCGTPPCQCTAVEMYLKLEAA